MAAPRAAVAVIGTAALHLDNPGWQDSRCCGPFKGRPVQVRNGLPDRVNYPLGRNQNRHSMSEEEAAAYLGSTWRPEKRKECS